QNLNLIRDFGPELVAVFGADHVYRMDLRHMIQFHLASRAAVSVAARPVPLAEASDFGIMTTAADGRINAFAEKPRSAEPIPGDPSSALASMGNYVFATEVLVDVLREDAARQSDHDFGRTIIPEQVRRHRLFAYNFRDHRVPGVRPHEEPAYWRDVGTIRSYYEAQMDQLGAAPASSRAARTPRASRCTAIPRASSSCRAVSPPARCPRRSSRKRVRVLALHGHFYQPPREHPWLGVVEPEPSAAPHRDWNARITAECYAPNMAARVF